MSLALKTKTLPVIVLICWLSMNSLAQAVDAGVHDTAKLFSSETVKKADDILKDIQQKTKDTVVIETVRGIPAEKRDAFRANRDNFYAQWAEARGKALKLHGTLVLICEETQADVASGKPAKRIEFWSDEETRKIFTKDDATHARTTLGKLFNSDPNQAFLNMVGEMKTTMESKYAASHPLANAAEKGVVANKHLDPKPAGNQHAAGGTDVTTIVIYIVVGLLGFWILIGLVRAFTRPRVQPGDYNAPPPPPGMGRGGMTPPPPPGYGQPYGQAYGGQPMGYAPPQSGGMGFFGNLMTGMLGAAAGNYMYDRFFRGDGGHSNYGGYGGSSASTGGGYFGGGSRGSDEPVTGYTTGGDLPSDDTGTSGGADYDQDMTGGGGDFGGGSSGGDFGGGGDTGGGGGDFGGGGGDFGGGGGDFGGGGGGDFSGGGDSGGGGGDF